MDDVYDEWAMMREIFKPKLRYMLDWTQVIATNDAHHHPGPPTVSDNDRMHGGSVGLVLHYGTLAFLTLVFLTLLYLTFVFLILVFLVVTLLSLPFLILQRGLLLLPSGLF